MITDKRRCFQIVIKNHIDSKNCPKKESSLRFNFWSRIGVKQKNLIFQKKPLPLIPKKDISKKYHPIQYFFGKTGFLYSKLQAHWHDWKSATRVEERNSRVEWKNYKSMPKHYIWKWCIENKAHFWLCKILIELVYNSQSGLNRDLPKSNAKITNR